MKQTARQIKAFAAFFLCVILIASASVARAADLPLAAASPLTGVSFDDRPLLLPVQRNFQMAMLTASSELGRSCGKMEAYGWRMSQSEQGRVNQIFNNTVDRLRLLSYNIAPQTLSSVSKDITLFTADRNDKHFIFLWSAGELGLVLNLCETSAPISATYHPNNLTPSVQTFGVPNDVVPAHLEAAARKTARNAAEFSPVGVWSGGYSCAQGYTGGTLEISHVHGQNFDGTFKFYPTTKNPGVPAGSYTIYGQYDNESKRILINPGKWIKRPRNFYNTVIVGSFDPVRDSFSSYFQGITGCTSFEASRVSEPVYNTPATKKHVVKKKKAVKKKPVAPVEGKSDLGTAPLTTDTLAPAPSQQPVVAAPAPTPAAPAATAPSAPPAPSIAPPSAPVTPPAKTPAAAPVPSSSAAPADSGILLPLSGK